MDADLQHGQLAEQLSAEWQQAQIGDAQSQGAWQIDGGTPSWDSQGLTLAGSAVGRRRWRRYAAA